MGAALAAILVTTVLRWVGLAMLDQLVFVGFLAVWTLTGAVVLNTRRSAFPDQASFYLCGLAIGMAVHMLLCFAGLQRLILAVSGVGTRPIAIGCFGLLGMIALLGAVLAFAHAKGARWIVQPRAIAGLWILAGCVATLSAFGFENNSMGDRESVRALTESGQSAFGRERVPNWGILADRVVHVLAYSEAVADSGLPVVATYLHPAARQRNEQKSEWNTLELTLGTQAGVPSSLVGVTSLSEPYSEPRVIAYSKALSLVWLSMIAIFLFLIAHDTLETSSFAASMAGAGGLLYAAWNPYIWTQLVSSKYIFASSGVLYYNVTQQASLAVGLAGLYLVLISLKRGDRLYGVGAFLIAASALYKPALFSVVGPAIVAASLLPRGNVARRDVAMGWTWLGALLVFWVGYPRLVGIETFSIDVELSPLETVSFFLPEAVPWDVGTPTRVLLTSLVLGYPALVIPVGFLAKGIWRGGPPFLGRLAGFVARPERLALLITFALGALGHYLLVEVGRMSFGNFMWGASVGSLCFLPILAMSLDRIGMRWIRRLGWILFSGNLISGAWNLWVYTMRPYI